MPLSWNEIRDRATHFATDWKDAGYERGEAQTFWNEFFGIFGMHRSRVYNFEHRVEKLDGGAGYIDCFWPGMMIAEHKSRGKPLGRAHVQAPDYLDGLKDREQPRYIVVSDFERIRLYDTEDNSEQEILTAELPKHIWRPAPWTGAAFPRRSSALCSSRSWTRKPGGTWARTTPPRPTSSS